MTTITTAARAATASTAATRAPHPTARTSRSAHGSAALLQTMLMGASHDVTFLVPDFDPSGVEFSVDLSHHVLRRSGRLRLVVQAEVADLAEVRAHAETLGSLGVVPRVADTVPAYAILIDHCIGVFGSKIIVGSRDLRRLSDLCDSLWRSSTPHPQATQQKYSARARRVIELLAEGLTDEAVARRLGVSVRTVRTDTAHTMARFEASSRFQAGVRAAQLGLA